MAGKRELFIFISFTLLAVSHCICVPCSVKMIDSQSQQATSNTSSSPSNSSELNTSATIIESESPLGTSESYSTASSTYSVSEANSALPLTAAAPATLNETLIFTGDKSSNFTSPNMPKAVGVDSSSSVGRSGLENAVYAAQPWMKLSRMTREEERGESQITDSNSIGELKEADAERVSFVTESASAWQLTEDEVNDTSDMPESDPISDGSRDEKENETTGENFGSSEDKFGAVYPYFYRQEFLRERLWPIYRKHPYNSYIKYPIFPGK